MLGLPSCPRGWQSGVVVRRGVAHPSWPPIPKGPMWPQGPEAFFLLMFGRLGGWEACQRHARGFPEPVGSFVTKYRSKPSHLDLFHIFMLVLRFCAVFLCYNHRL